MSPSKGKNRARTRDNEQLESKWSTWRAGPARQVHAEQISQTVRCTDEFRARADAWSINTYYMPKQLKTTIELCARPAAEKIGIKMLRWSGRKGVA